MCIRDSIKPSVQRIAIMNYLIEHRTHPTVDEIYTALSPSIPTLSKTCLLYTSSPAEQMDAVQKYVLGSNPCC